KLHERFPFLPTLPGKSKPDQPAPDPGATLKPIASAIGGSIEVLGGLVVVFFLGVYGAAQPDAYRKAALAVTPQRYEARMTRALSAIANNLSRWLIGRCVAMLFVGVASTIGFHLLQVPIALALGVFAGTMTFIEYAGAVISALPPILFALAQSPTAALGVAILFTGLHVIEGYILTPLLTRAAAHVPPALTLASQVILGSLAGPLGLTFSTPLLVASLSAVKSWRESESTEETESNAKVQVGAALP
ncbi:MAG TPA: AI-2E family transporter, partial [Polyangiales bacterium]|nr:AI-2E family transporter [Polyangiales bacterium]